MAELLEQKQIVQAVCELHKPVNENILEYFENRKLFKSDKALNFISQQVQEKRDRERRILRLVQSCEQDGFIKADNEEYEDVDIQTAMARAYRGSIPGVSWTDPPMRTFTRNMGYSATSRGTDLLNIVGLTSIAFQKHSSLITFIWGAIAITGVSMLVKLITHWPEIRQFILPHFL